MSLRAANHLTRVMPRICRHIRPSISSLNSLSPLLERSAANEVGLQLLLEPSNTAYIFRSGCVAAGAVYPAYKTYKAVLTPKRAAAAGRYAAVNGTESDRWLKYWAIFGLTYLGERMLEGQLERFPYYPHLKFAFLLWLQMHDGHGAAVLFDHYITPHLSRYERKLDTLLEVGAQVTELFYSTYAVPLQALHSSLQSAVGQLAVFMKWLATPDEPEDTLVQQQQQQQQRHTGGSSSCDVSSDTRVVVRGGAQGRQQALW